VKVISRPQLPDSYCLYHKFAEKRRDVQHGAGLRGVWEKASSKIECPHRNRAWHPNSVTRSCGNQRESKQRDEEESARGFDPPRSP
jgi:hypothetical protein